ncbi:MAG: polyphosphate polymerase domain-containing protein [Candidatus Gracilibacteria bacterium]|nr:polyphosphate polymerase domain-containing protein [Candidatus Gracilibacteria bacterium]
MKIIRKFNRFELKYLLPLKLAEEFKQELKKYLLPDNRGQNGKYPISSLYYDAPDYRFYWEKIEGIKFRRKLRIRRYLEDKAFTGDSTVFLEIKQRVDRVTQKRRLPLKYQEALDFCNHGLLPDCQQKDRVLLEEMESMLKLYNLKPSVITTYDRQAFVGTDYDLGLRITFDTDICYKFHDLDLGKETLEGFMIPPTFTIMEVKTDERIPYWLSELLAAYNLRLIRVSKYCQGLEAASVLPKSIYHIS